MRRPEKALSTYAKSWVKEVASQERCRDVNREARTLKFRSRSTSWGTRLANNGHKLCVTEAWDIKSERYVFDPSHVGNAEIAERISKGFASPFLAPSQPRRIGRASGSTIPRRLCTRNSYARALCVEKVQRGVLSIRMGEAACSASVVLERRAFVKRYGEGTEIPQCLNADFVVGW